jgi:SAM-dependent methyltransferase
MNRLREWTARFGRNTWRDWPSRAYKRSGLQARLATVERHLWECIDLAPAGAVRIVSVCAGDGRDVTKVVEEHPRRADVSAWLVEADVASIETGKKLARGVGLHESVRFLHADATTYAIYTGLGPADVVLLCGVWGHVPPADRASVASALHLLCQPGGMVIWTRGRRSGPWRFDEIRSHFDGREWDEVRTTFTDDGKWAVATFRTAEPADPLPTNGRIFSFQTGAG